MLKESIAFAIEILYIVWVVFVISFCSGMFIENPVIERSLKIRYLLNVSGLSQTIYWIGTFLFDYILFTLQSILLVYLVIKGELKAYTDNMGLFLTLLALFGVSHINFSYFMSFFFQNSSSALKAFAFIYLVGGFFFPFLLKSYIFASYGCTPYHIAEVATQLIPIQTFFEGVQNFIINSHLGYLEIDKQIKDMEGAMSGKNSS